MSGITNIKVSVIVPVYNSSEYLHETLDSLINQSLKEIEIICVDDGSTDNSLDILKEYEIKDSRIIVISQKNSGAGAARNKGLSIAHGEYLSFLDSDDFFENRMLELAYKDAQENNVDIDIFRMDRYYPQTGEYERCKWSVRTDLILLDQVFSLKDIKRDVFKAFVGWAWDKLFRREFILSTGLKFQELRTTNDMYFVFSALTLAERIYFTDRTLIHQRTNLKNSLSVTREKSWNCYYEALCELRKGLKNNNLYNVLEQDYINYSLHFSLWNLETLKEPAFSELYKKLKNEYFNNLGISGKRKSYFYAKGEYSKYRYILKYDSLDYRLHYGLEKIEKKVEIEVSNHAKVNNPKVSILIPVYNVEKFIKECLNSVVNQSLKEIEIICINDGSTDNSLEIMKQYAELDRRIVILDGANSGYGNAMNRGIKAATGEYIGIVEPDDYVSVDMYKELYDTAKAFDIDIVKADFYRFVDDKQGERKLTYISLKGGNPDLYNKVCTPTDDSIVFKYALNTWAGIYKRKMILDNKIVHNETPGASFQDNGFWFQTFCFAKNIYFIDKPYYYNRRDNPNSSVYDPLKVYCMCDEYKFIYNFLNHHIEFKDKYIGYYQFRRYHNYMMNFERITNSRRSEFLMRFYQEFKNDYESGELKEEFFSDNEWQKIKRLLSDPIDFYSKIYRDKNQSKIAYLENDRKRIYNSLTYKIGNAVTIVPRKIRKKYNELLNNRFGRASIE